MEKLKFELEQDVKDLLDIITKSTKLLKDAYKKLYRVVVLHSIIIIIYCISSVYFANVIKSDYYLYISFFIGQLLIQILLLIYYRHQKNISNNYFKIYKGGYKAWCYLSDKIDWGIWRKKFFYKENYEISIVMKKFYAEFERPFSPARTYNNYYKIVTLILVLVRLIILIYVTWLMFSFTINK